MPNKPPIKKRPLTEDKKPRKANREAVLTAQGTVQKQLQVQDSADIAAGGPPRRVDAPDPFHHDDEEGSTAAPGSGDGMLNADGTTKTKEERHQQRMDWFYAEASRQAANRRLMARDEAFYDGEQINAEDSATYAERGQKPVFYNEVAPTIDWLIGTERRSRVDFYVVAEDDDDVTNPGETTPSDDAINKTKLLKYLDDVNMAPFERSYAAEDAFKAGLGILEIGARGDKTGVPVFIGAESWRNFLHDSRAKKDQSDARYNFRVKEVDLDIAIRMFPEKEAILRASATAGDNRTAIAGLHGISGQLGGLDSFGEYADGTPDYDGQTSRTLDVFNTRDRVTFIECWSREPIRNPDFDPATGLGDPIAFKIRVAIMIEEETLIEAWSPYKHDRFPFVLVWGYRNKRTGMPYAPTRRLIGPQEGLNKRMMRGLFESSFNQLEMEEDALNEELMDIEQLHIESNDPTGTMIYARGALTAGKVRWRDNPGAAREQILLAEGDRQALRAMSGVNEENRGLKSQATSRVAMDAKAERGSVATSELFDNLLLARQQEGELTLSVCEQFCTYPLTVRVAGEQGANKFERTKLNQPGLNPVTGEPTYLNDITQRRAHFVVGEQAWKQSYAEGAFASLMEVLTQLSASAPQIVVGLLDVVFDMHPNLPRKKTVIERIRKLNGQTDPDGKMTPEEQQAAQQQAAIAQAQFELQMAQLKADVAKAQAQGEQLSTKAILDRVTALYESAQAAQVLAQSPHLAPITDAVLASAGYKDLSGSPNTLGAEGMAPAPVQQAAPPPQELMQADGAQQGIETPAADGLQP